MVNLFKCQTLAVLWVSVLHFVHCCWRIISNPAPFVLAVSSIKVLMNKRRQPMSLQLHTQKGGGGHTFRKGDNFFRSSPTCSDSKEEAAYACGLSLKAWVQTYCSASGLVFVMQNCKHISQSRVKKARLRICYLNGWTRTSRGQLMLYDPISGEISSFLLKCCCLVPFSASSVLCLLNQSAKASLSSWHILSFNTLIAADYCREPGNVATIIALWHNM